MVLELRPAHNPTKAYGFVGVVVSLKDLSSSIWGWYREGGEVSERQWRDVLAVLSVNGAELDFEYMSTWATRLGITSLLERARIASPAQ